MRQNVLKIQKSFQKLFSEKFDVNKKFYRVYSILFKKKPRKIEIFHQIFTISFKKIVQLISKKKNIFFEKNVKFFQNLYTVQKFKINKKFHRIT